MIPVQQPQVQPFALRHPNLFSEVNNCITRYAAPENFSESLKWIVFRIVNAVKAAFSCLGCCESNWQQIKRRCSCEITQQLTQAGNLAFLPLGVTPHIDAFVEMTLSNYLKFYENRNSPPKELVKASFQFGSDLACFVIDVLPTAVAFIMSNPNFGANVGRAFVANVGQAVVAHNPDLAPHYNLVTSLIPHLPAIFLIGMQNLQLFNQMRNVEQHPEDIIAGLSALGQQPAVINLLLALGQNQNIGAALGQHVNRLLPILRNRDQLVNLFQNPNHINQLLIDLGIFDAANPNRAAARAVNQQVEGQPNIAQS